MAIHYRFGSEKNFKSVLVEGAFITVASFKNTLRDLAEHDLTRSRERFTDVLFVADAHTGEKFSGDAALIPRNASVLIRRLPSRPTLPIAVGTSPNPNVPSEKSETELPSSGTEDFGPGIYSTPSSLPVKANPGAILAEEDIKIKPLAKALTTPPQGYVCHRCNVPGHFIKGCPTNADPSYPYKRRPTTSVTSAFHKEAECLPSMCCSSASDHLIPPELCCPLCKQVMKDAVFAKKCCFKSFCYTCIRDHYIDSKFECVCGARGVLADDLVPNITLQETISRVLGSGSSSSSGNAVTSRYRSPNTMSTMPQVQNTTQKPKKQPVHVPGQQQQQVQQQSRKRSMASNGVPKTNLQQKRARAENNVPAGVKMPQVPPFGSYQDYWYGQPYVYGMSYGMAAASSYQLY